MKNLIKKLNEPFPERATFKDNVLSLLGVGVFVTLFLYLLRPFGLSNYPNDPFWICAIFGLISFAVGFFLDVISTFVLKIRKDIPSWTLGKWMIDVSILILCITIGNYLFMSFLDGWDGFSLGHFGYMLISTLAVGIFPIAFSGMTIQMKALKKNEAQAATIQANLHHPPKNKKEITLSSHNNSQSLDIVIDQLYYLESMQNYVGIYYLEVGKIKKELLRNTLTEMEKQLENTPLFRCHRSFIVNTDLIEKVSGNAQGLRLNLEKLPDSEIPVSRKYIPSLKAIIS